MNAPSLPHLASGKVRELYGLDGGRMLLVASDRISTFDVVLPTEIPDKGRVLTGLPSALVLAFLPKEAITGIGSTGESQPVHTRYRLAPRMSAISVAIA